MMHVVSPPKMVVCHVISGDLWAGAESQAFTLITHLPESVKCYVIILNQGELASRLINAGIDTAVYDEQAHSSREIFFAIRNRLKQIRPDIVHTHRIKENIIGSIANLCSVRARSVRTVHGAPEFKAKGARAILEALDTFCANYLQDKIISVSDQLTPKLEKQYNKGKVITIVNGVVEIQYAASEENKPSEFVPYKKNIAIIGRLTAVKRVDLFIKAAEKLALSSPDYGFHIIGSGELNEQLKAQAAATKCTDNIIFHGHKKNISVLLAALDAVVMTSDHEGLPMTALEAVSYGVPVVAHKVGGLIKLLEAGNGYLCKSHTVEEYVDLIEKALYKQNGEPSLPKQYTANENARMVVKLYESLL